MPKNLLKSTSRKYRGENANLEGTLEQRLYEFGEAMIGEPITHHIPFERSIELGVYYEFGPYVDVVFDQTGVRFTVDA